LGIPALPDGDFAAPDPVGKAVRAAAGVLRYWACAETCKVNPATGARMEDGYGGAGSDDYKKANAVWDAGANRVQLSVARNEVAGFQLIVERLGAALSNVRVSVSDLAGPGGATIPASTHIEAFQLHYVAKSGIYYPDAAIPLAAPFPKSFAIPDAIHNPGGTNQAVWHDIYVPANAAVGVYTGTLALEADELASPVAIELQLRVEHPVLPDVPSFLVDLNGYGNK